MMLVDTSIWIDHFRRNDSRLAQFLDRGGGVMPSLYGETRDGRHECTCAFGL